MSKSRLVTPGEIIHLGEKEEAAMALDIATLQANGQGYAAWLLLQMYDIDEVWIAELRHEIESQQQTAGGHRGQTDPLP